MPDTRPDGPLNRRQHRLWDLHDFSIGRGLEIGPLHNTSVRREHADVKYLDVFDRDLLLKNYEGHPQVLPGEDPRDRLRALRRRAGALDPGDDRRRAGVRLGDGLPRARARARRDRLAEGDRRGHRRRRPAGAGRARPPLLLRRAPSRHHGRPDAAGPRARRDRAVGAGRLRLQARPRLHQGAGRVGAGSRRATRRAIYPPRRRCSRRSRRPARASTSTPTSGR